MRNRHNRNGRNNLPPNGSPGREYPQYIEHHHYNWGQPISNDDPDLADDKPMPPAPPKPTNYMPWVIALLIIMLIVISIGFVGANSKKNAVPAETVKETVKEKVETPSNTNKKSIVSGDDAKNINIGDNNKNTKVHVGDNKISQNTQINNVTIINKHVKVVQPVKVVRVPMHVEVKQSSDCDDLKLRHEVIVDQWQAMMNAK